MWGMINEADNIPANFGVQTVTDIRGRADPGTKIMAAFGGWGQDAEFAKHAASGSMETIASNMIDFVDKQKL